MTEQDFVQAGFTVVGSETSQNKLLHFLKENYPSVIKDNEIDLTELKAVAGLPIDEKTNGYGLNFVGRHFARAKYAQKTQQELCLNRSLSVAEMTTQNLVLKGDNLDSLKILKSHYSGKIKCIYIDPPYNTTSDEFVYPDKFDKEEAEVLGLANLSESDFARMDFSFKSKKSHNGWLAFMYPRLLLARDLLSKDGVIFISIDDNEQANLKLLCDDVFGEENVETLIWNKEAENSSGTLKQISTTRRIHEYIICIYKSYVDVQFNKVKEALKGKETDFQTANLAVNSDNEKKDHPNYFTITNPHGDKFTKQWKWDKNKIEDLIKNDLIYWGSDGHKQPRLIIPTDDRRITFLLSILNYGGTTAGRKDFEDLLGDSAIFSYPKPIILLKKIIETSSNNDSIILDFFAGSGTTGHAVMQLNAQDGGNRKFILCQIDQPISQDKPAYQFCINNNLPPVISSITIERLKRAGEKIAQEIQEANSKTGLFEEDKKQVPDTGFKVFDSVPAPQLTIDEQGQIVMPSNNIDALSRIYNMMFTVGLDEPTQTPQEVVKDCIYKIGNHYYITNSHNISNDDYVNAIKNGKVFIDGWTASLNATLRHYKDDVKIVF
jgi:adenine-specific DNA-methyltransferase